MMTNTTTTKTRVALLLGLLLSTTTRRGEAFAPRKGRGFPSLPSLHDASSLLRITQGNVNNNNNEKQALLSSLFVADVGDTTATDPQHYPMNETMAYNVAVVENKNVALDTSSAAAALVGGLLVLGKKSNSNNNNNHKQQELDYAVKQTSATNPTTVLSTSSWSWEQPPLWLGRVLALVAAAIYGTNFAAVKILNDSLPVSLAASLRFGIGFVAVAATVLWSEQARDAQQAGEQYFQVYDCGEEVIPVSKAELYKERTDAMWAGAQVGLWYAAGYIVQALALLEVDASKSAFYNAAAILVVPVLDMAFKDKKLGLPGIISISLAMFGMGLLQLGDAGSAGMTFTMGDVLCACQALFFGIGYWRLEDGADKYPAQAGRITMGILLGVVIGAFSYSAAMNIVPPAEAIWLTLLHIPHVTASLLWTGLGSTAGALYLETVALKAISATELTILMTSVSLWGSAFAYVTMGEVLSPIGMAGGAMLLGGCLVSSLMGEKEAEPEASFVLSEDDTAILVSEATDYDSIEEAVATSMDCDISDVSLASDGVCL